MSLHSELVTFLTLFTVILPTAQAASNQSSPVEEQAPEALGIRIKSAARDFMAMLGDSISAAAIAETHTTFPSLPSLNLFTLGDIAREGWIALVENKNTLSWGSGSKVKSHFARLNAVSERPVTVINAAVSGAMAQDTIAQANRILASAQSGRFEDLKYVTFWIGANDACSSTPLKQMHDDLMQSFAILSKIDQKEPIRVLVPAIPAIPQLGQPEIRQRRTADGWSCRWIQHDVLKFCEPLLNWKTPEEKAQADEIVDERNALLRQVVDEVNQTYPNIQARYSDVPHNLNLTFDMLAADCFHPDSHTHALISEHLWADQPWF